MAKSSKVVKPIIKVDGETNLLESIFDGPKEEMPEIKSIGFAKLSTASHGWVSYIITTKGKEVLSVEVSEPDLKQIAEEGAKINFVNCFVDQAL